MKIELDKNKLKYLYNDKKMTIKQIANYYNINVKTVFRNMKEYGIRRRIPNKKYNYNEDIFDDLYNEEVCYWLGFIYADGWISLTTKKSKRLSIELSYKDKNHLQKFCTFIGTDKLFFRKPKEKKIEGRPVIGTGSYFCTINSNKIVETLEKLGIEYNKTNSFNVTIFKNIPKKYKKYFIRGFIDGDGTIGLTKNDYMTFSFVGNKYMLELISKQISFELNLNERTLYEHGNIHKMAFSGKYQVPKILNWLYKDAKIYLDRKYDTYQNILKLEGLD
jgi:hypothetical protein